MAINEGQKVITVGRFGSKCANFKSGGVRFSVPVWIGKEYIAKRNRFGEMKWFYNGTIVNETIASKYPSQTYTDKIKAMASEDRPFVNYVVHLERVN